MRWTMRWPIGCRCSMQRPRPCWRHSAMPPPNSCQRWALARAGLHSPFPCHPCKEKSSEAVNAMATEQSLASTLATARIKLTSNILNIIIIIAQVPSLHQQFYVKLIAPGVCYLKPHRTSCIQIKGVLRIFDSAIMKRSPEQELVAQRTSVGLVAPCEGSPSQTQALWHPRTYCSHWTVTQRASDKLLISVILQI